MRALAWAAIVLAALLIVGAVVCFFAAIWIVGPNSGRVGTTGFTALTVGFFLAFGGTCWLDTHRSDR